MSHRYKLLVLDVDGTLVQSKADALPTQRVIDAVRSAQATLNVAFATGRSLKNTQPIIDALSFLQGPSVFNGGSDIIDLTTGETVFRQTMSVETLRELLRLALPFGYGVRTDADHYTAVLTKPADVQMEAAQFFIEAVRVADALNMVEMFSSVEGVSAQLASSWEDGDVIDIQVTHEYATKRYGVERVMHMLALEAKDVIAIGDGYNDVPMLEAAGFRVAMGNAPDEVKAIADYVAPSLDDDGAAEAIERFICGMASGR